MDVIHVPRPPKKAINLDRQDNALIMAQVSHLQHAERRLPLKYRTEIYTHAIQTASARKAPKITPSSAVEIRCRTGLVTAFSSRYAGTWR